QVQESKPLDALGQRTFNSIMPDTPAVLRGMDKLSDDIVNAIAAGKDPSTFKFDPAKHTMNEVLGMGLMSVLKLVAEHKMDAMDAIDKVDAYSVYLRDLYHQSNPSVQFNNPLTPV